MDDGWPCVTAVPMNGIPTALLLFLFERGSRVKLDVEVDSIGSEEGVATHCSILSWRTSMTEEPGGIWSKGSQRVRHE